MKLNNPLSRERSKQILALMLYYFLVPKSRYGPDKPQSPRDELDHWVFSIEGIFFEGIKM